MKKIKILLTLAFMLTSFAAYAQLPGYQPYQVVAIIMNGQRSEPNTSQYIKFDGNLVIIDSFGNGQLTSRFIDSGEYSDGNKVYYQQAYNYGTINQGSGWITNRNIWLLVSPDRKHINKVDKIYKTTTVYKIQTASSAGSMVY